MKIGLKEIIIIAVVTVVSFPVLYFVMLFATGNARIVFTSRTLEDMKNRQQLNFIKHSARKDSIAAKTSNLYQAIKNERKEIEDERAKLNKQKERINLLQQELEKTKEELSKERKKFEKVISSSDEFENKKIKQLAKVYSAMRANEAAKILETLDDDLVVKIITAIGDDRQKAKIMSNISAAKASRISKKMGKSVSN